MRALRLSLAEYPDMSEVEPAWRALEARADASFFRSWTWVGCLAERRFSRPVLLTATWRDRVVALGLLNRKGWWLEPDTLWLGESGHRQLDAVFVEHNGLLVERGWSGLLAAHCLRMLATLRLDGRAPWRGRRVLLSGIDLRLAAALPRGGLRLRASSVQSAPLVDLRGLHGGETDFLDRLSANTRAQLRRSNRGYATTGTPTLARAATVQDAHGYLDRLAMLHQQTWTRRGQRGAFANPAFAAFHHALIDRGFGDGTIDLLRIAAGERVIGYLYNFRYRGRVSAYQSGFAYDADDKRLKPGLTCHALAIAQAVADGCTAYDFLAGENRYKRSFANAEEKLFWGELLPPCSLRGMVVRRADPLAEK